MTEKKVQSGSNEKLEDALNINITIAESLDLETQVSAATCVRNEFYGEKLLVGYLKLTMKFHGPLAVFTRVSSGTFGWKICKINYNYIFLYMFTLSWQFVNLFYRQYESEGAIHKFDTCVSMVVSVYWMMFVTYWHSLNQDGIEKMKYKYSYEIWKHLLTKTQLWHLTEHTQISKILVYIFAVVLILVQISMIFLVTAEVSSQNTSKIIIYTLFGMSVFVWFQQRCETLFFLISIFWFRELITKNVLINLQSQSQISVDSINSNINDNSLFEWYKNVYKPNWIKIYTNVKLAKCQFIFFGFMLTWGLQVWRSTSKIINHVEGTVTSVDTVNVIFRLGVVIMSCYSIFVFVFFLCQQTKYYHEIKATINKIMVDSFDKIISFNTNGSMNNSSNNFWVYGDQCLKSISIYSMKGTIGGYQMSWIKLFRATIVFAFFKILLYILEQDFDNYW